MTISGLKLPLVLFVALAPYFAASTPLHLEDLDLSNTDPATYQFLTNQRPPDCIDIPSSNANKTRPTRPGGNGNGGGPRPTEEKTNFRVIVNGFCCETVFHTAPTGSEYMLVITHIQNIEPQGSMGFYDMIDDNNKRLIRMIVKTEEGIEGDFDPPLMERSETGTVMGEFCGGPEGISEFRYNLNAVPSMS